MDKKYTDLNAEIIDKWTQSGWEWGKPINHEIYENAQKGDWFVLLTPTKPVPKDWFPELNGAKVLGLASGGGQQMPIFTACGAKCTVLDYSQSQLESERIVAEREGYSIDIVRADMTNPLPFDDACFDMIFHPVSNCYVEDIIPIWKECYRVLKKGGVLLVGFDNGINFAYNEDETELMFKLPFNPFKDKKQYEESLKNDWGFQFSHTIEEQIGGQLRAGFNLADIYQDIRGEGKLSEYNIPTFYATKAIK